MSHIRTEKETYQALLISLMLMVNGILLSLLVSLRLSRAFTDPVFQLNEAVAKLKEGKLDTRVYTRAGPEFEQLESGLKDRKSTRLNSSHVRISYAVFCLKKKKIKKNKINQT